MMMKLIDFCGVSGDPRIYINRDVLNYVNGQNALSAGIVEDTCFHWVVNSDSSHSVITCIDGELQFSFTDNSLTTAMHSTDDFNSFIDDVATNTEDPQGIVARLMIYDHALTENKVSELEIIDNVFFSDFEMMELP